MSFDIGRRGGENLSDIPLQLQVTSHALHVTSYMLHVTTSVDIGRRGGGNLSDISTIVVDVTTVIFRPEGLDDRGRWLVRRYCL